MSPLNLFLMSAVIIPLVILLANDYKSGLFSSIFLLIFLSSSLAIETGFFTLTIHRLIVIVLFIAWMINKGRRSKISEVPFLKLLSLFGIAALLSTAVSVAFTVSIKELLSFVIEVLLYYMIVITSIEGKKDALRMLSYIALALTLVAILAIIERYTGFNPVDSFIAGYQRKSDYIGNIMSTYPHRILLGTAMAMGWPISMALADERKKSPLRYYLTWLSIVLMIAACYFSFSRGPWIASILAGTVMFFLGSSGVKKRSLVIIALVIFALIIKPGILDTITDLSKATFDPETLKGSSYSYRWELWKKAYSEVAKSSERMTLGYGPGTSHVMDLRGAVSYSDFTSQFWSWDNQYACYLLEMGFFGLIVAGVLFLKALLKMLILWLRTEKPFRNIMSSVVAGVIVFLFMMMNVYIFAPQLKYLFWALITAGIHMGAKESPTKTT